MGRRMRLVNVENVSYNDVVDVVDDNEMIVPENEAEGSGDATEVENKITMPEPEEEEEEEQVAVSTPEEPEEIEEVKPIETKPKRANTATCEGCGKTMTVKNLRYAHKLICPANAKATVSQPLLEEETSEEEVKPAPKPKAKSKAKAKAEVIAEGSGPEAPKILDIKPELRRISKAMAKSQKYEQLAMGAF